MNVAITVWKHRVSPVFDSAQTLLIAEIEGNALVSTSYLTFELDRPLELLRMLRAQNVRTMICGAISEGPANMLLGAGFELISFIAGDALRVLEAYIKGDPLGEAFKMPGCNKNICCRGKIRRGGEIATFQMERVFLRVLFIAKDIAQFPALVAGLQRQPEIQLLSADTGAAGFSLLKGTQIDLVIVDELLGDMSGVAFVKQLVKINPLVNTAIVSGLTAAEFHEATEGLGVLMQLPMEPREKDAKALLAILGKIGALLEPMARQPQKVATS